jgi:glycosyltransferase involved in cell wall biosynthesis
MLEADDVPAREPGHAAEITKMGEIAAEAGLRRINMLGWRDFDDPEAGGSEVHAEEIARLWAEAGLEITLRTSYAPGHPRVSWRNGHRVVRKAGRYMVFPRAAISEMMQWHGSRDAVVEIWNGMPFFAPVWARCPYVIFQHHVHGEMWEMTLPPRLARLGRFFEERLAPVFYRNARVITVSESSQRELIEDLGFNPRRVSVVHNGLDARFTPGRDRSSFPLVLAVGRLVPVKRFDRLIDALAQVRVRFPDLRAVIVGDGYKREELEAQIQQLRAEEWLSLPGRISDADLVALYQQAWIVASTSAREGWGLSVTEAAACGTPVVATRSPGLMDSVRDNESGLLIDTNDEMVAALTMLIESPEERERLGRGGLAVASRLTWPATARQALEVLAEEAIRHRGRPDR